MWKRKKATTHKTKISTIRRGLLKSKNVRLTFYLKGEPHSWRVWHTPHFSLLVWSFEEVKTPPPHNTKLFFCARLWAEQSWKGVFHVRVWWLRVLQIISISHKVVFSHKREILSNALSYQLKAPNDLRVSMNEWIIFQSDDLIATDQGTADAGGDTSSIIYSFYW